MGRRCSRSSRGQKLPKGKKSRQSRGRRCTRSRANRSSRRGRRGACFRGGARQLDFSREVVMRTGNIANKRPVDPSAETNMEKKQKLNHTSVDDMFEHFKTYYSEDPEGSVNYIVRRANQEEVPAYQLALQGPQQVNVFITWVLLEEGNLHWNMSKNGRLCGQGISPNFDTMVDAMKTTLNL